MDPLLYFGLLDLALLVWLFWLVRAYGVCVFRHRTPQGVWAQLDHMAPLRIVGFAAGFYAVNMWLARIPAMRYHLWRDGPEHRRAVLDAATNTDVFTAFALLFFLVVPLAYPAWIHLQECAFRDGVQERRTMIRNSLINGLMYLLLNASLHTALTMTLAALYLGESYRRDVCKDQRSALHRSIGRNLIVSLSLFVLLPAVDELVFH